MKDSMTLDSLKAGEIYLISPTQAARFVNRDPRTIMKNLRSNEWVSVRMGNRYYIPVPWFLAYLEGVSRHEG